MRLALFILIMLFPALVSAQLKETSRQEMSKVNLLGSYNPGFENGLARWTYTGSSTLTLDTNVKYGAASAIWDASATDEYLKTFAVSLNDGQKGNSCMWGLYYKWPSGTAGDVKIQVYDGSTNLLAEKDITVTDTWIYDYVAFNCPNAATTIQGWLTSTADAAAVTLDQAWLGDQNNLVDVSQVEVVANAYYAPTANCSAWNVASTSLSDFATDADCPAITVISSSYAVDTTDNNLPDIDFDSLPPGIYSVYATATLTTGGANRTIRLAISDGTDDMGITSYESALNDIDDSVNVSGIFTYTSAGARNFKLRGSISAGTLSLINDATNYRLNFTVYRYPLASEKAVSLDTQGMLWQGRHAADCAFARSNVAYGEFNVDSTCTFTEVVNQNFGTVTSKVSGSDKLPGIVITPRKSGYFYLCGKPVVTKGSATASSAYRLTDGTIIYDESEHHADGGDEAESSRLCGLVYGNVGAPKTIYFEGKASASGIILGAYVGETQSIGWTIFPITQNFPQAVAITGTPISMPEISATPQDPEESAQGKIYIKGDKFIIQFNDAGTIRYKYLDLTGTGVTWVHTTSAP